MDMAEGIVHNRSTSDGGICSGGAPLKVLRCLRQKTTGETPAPRKAATPFSFDTKSPRNQTEQPIPAQTEFAAIGRPAFSHP
jgi:hypothetical protein